MTHKYNICVQFIGPVMTSDVNLPEKYFPENFPKHFWKFSEEPENYV